MCQPCVCVPCRCECHRPRPDIDDYRDPLLQWDAQFLCGYQRMETTLLTGSAAQQDPHIDSERPRGRKGDHLLIDNYYNATTKKD